MKELQHEDVTTVGALHVVEQLGFAVRRLGRDFFRAVLQEEIPEPAEPREEQECGDHDGNTPRVLGTRLAAVLRGRLRLSGRGVLRTNAIAALLAALVRLRPDPTLCVTPDSETRLTSLTTHAGAT